MDDDDLFSLLKQPFVPVTVYRLPHGERTNQEAPVSKEVETKYKELAAAGFWLEGECLTTGEVAITITSREMDHRCIISPNGPEVREGLERMILDADVEELKRELAALAEEDEE